MTEPQDLSAFIDADSMACCPICDNAILDWEPACLIFAHDCKCLGHIQCAEELVNGDEEE